MTAERTYPKSVGIAILAGLAFFYIFTQLSIVGPLNKTLSIAHHLSLSQIGIFSSLYFIGITIFYLPAGRLVDCYTPRHLLLLGLAVSIIASAVFANADNYLLLCFARIMEGMSHALVFISCMRVVTNYSLKYMARTIGIMIMVGLLGGIFTQYPFVKLMSIIGWHDALNIVVGMGVLIWLVEMLFLPKTKINSHDAQHQPIFVSLWLIVKNIKNTAYGLYACMMNLSMIFIGASWGNRHIESTYHLSAIAASQVLLWLYVGFIVGSPFSGWLSDRMQKRKHLMIISGVLLLICSFLWAATTLSIVMLMVMTCLIGFLSAFQVLSYSCIASGNSAVLGSLAMGYASVLIMGGSALMTALIGWLLEYFHKNNDVLLIIPGLLLLGCAILLPVKEGGVHDAR